MKKEILNKLKKEMSIIGILLISFILIFKIVFFKENLMVIFRIIISIFWMFALPGYAIMFYWNNKLGFTERLIIGIALSAAIMGIFSYYLGIIGLNIKYHSIILPLIMILTGIFVNIKEIKNPRTKVRGIF